MKPHAGQPLLTAGSPPEQSRGAVILVHGRGDSAANILQLADVLNRPAFTYLAPQAAGRTWYPYSFLTDIALNEPGLSSGLEVLHQLVTDLEGRGFRKDQIVLLGFSQGACLSAEFVVRHPGRYGGVIVLSGGLIGPPGTQWNGEGRLDGTLIFLGCSDVDPHIPVARVKESAAVLTSKGATVTTRLFPGMGHLINDEEIAAAQDLLDRIPARQGQG